MKNNIKSRAGVVNSRCAESSQLFEVKISTPFWPPFAFLRWLTSFIIIYIRSCFKEKFSQLQIWHRTTMLFWMAFSAIYIWIWEGPRGNKVMSYCKGSRNKHRSKFTTFHIEICRQAVSFFYSLAHLFYLCCCIPLSFLVLGKCQGFSYFFSTVPLSIYIGKLQHVICERSKKQY